MTYHPDWIGLCTIVRKEVGRIFRIWPQTILPSVMTQWLYFVIFGGMIGSRIGEVGGLSYQAFLVPGLVMMGGITNAFTNTASSFFGAKFQRSIEEILVSPMKPWALMLGFVSGGVVRASVVCFFIYLISTFYAPVSIDHPIWLFVFFLMTVLIFSLLGLINGVFARKFDDVGIVPIFVLTPLTYLGGVFYDIRDISPFWQKVSAFNPIVYMIDGIRYGFYSQTSTNISLSVVMLCFVCFVLMISTYVLIKKGVGLRS